MLENHRRDASRRRDVNHQGNGKMSKHENPEVEAPPLEAPAVGHDWNKLRLEYLRENLHSGRAERFTLADLAKRQDISHGLVRNVAARDGWTKQLEEMLVTVNAEATSALQERFRVKEIDVRLRQAAFCQIVMTKAMSKLLLMEADELTAKDAIALLSLGLQQERRAMGIAEEVSIEVMQEQAKRNEDRYLEAVKKSKEILGRLRTRLASTEPIDQPLDASRSELVLTDDVCSVDPSAKQ